MAALRAWSDDHGEFSDIEPILASAKLPATRPKLDTSPSESEPELVISNRYLPPVIECLSVLSRGSDSALAACEKLKVNLNSEFERRTAIAFELLGLSVERLGQGAGRNPDGIAKCFEQHWAIIYDAKVRTSEYRLLTDEDRKFREYIERMGNQLRDQGIGKYYFAVVSSGFLERDVPKARELVRLTYAKSCVLVEADALTKMIEERLRKPQDFTHNVIERLFLDTRILRANDI